MNSTDDDRFMGLALAEAERGAREGQTPFGAVLVDREGKVVGAGHNRVRADRDPSAHGEIMAIRDAWRRLGRRELLADCTLYTSCEPCLMCSYNIAQLGIPRVVFAARGSDVPNHRKFLGTGFPEAAAWVNRQPGWAPLEVRGEFMREEARRIIDAFDWSEA